VNLGKDADYECRISKEAPSVRNAWFQSTLTGIAALGLLVVPTHANPAGMTLQRPQQSATEVAAPVTPISPVPPTLTDRPSAQISPFRNPVKYFVASLSEMPIGFRSAARAPDKPTAPPATPDAGITPITTTDSSLTPQLAISAAQAHERQGDVQQARQQYGKALVMWPGEPEVLRAAARMEDRLGELNMAEILYRQAVAANPQHAGVLNDLGLCLARQGRLEESVQVIERAIQLQPDKALYRNNAATVLVEMRQDQRALGHLSAVHNAAEANYNMGQLLVQRGREQDAAPYFQAAVEQNPHLESARMALTRLHQGVSNAQAPTPTGLVAQPHVTGVPPTPAPVASSQFESQTVQQQSPHQVPQLGPQLSYPTATEPTSGNSTYPVLPGYGASAPPSTPVYHGANTYPSQSWRPGTGGTVGNATHRYLPPVASQPPAPRR